MNKLKHIDHVEDIFLSHGPNGFEYALNLLRSTAYRMGDDKYPAKITVKYDGSPAIIWGRLPNDRRFFIGTKGALNKAPKVAYSRDDIDKLYGHDEGLHEKMMSAYASCQCIHLRGVFQSDMIFYKPIHVNGNKVQFKPNTLLYSMEDTSGYADKLLSASFGLVTHTTYHGKTLEELKSSCEVDADSFFSLNSVYHLNPTVPSFYPFNRWNDFNAVLQEAYQRYMKLDPIFMFTVTDHLECLKMYVNHHVRHGGFPTPYGLKIWIDDRLKKRLRIKNSGQLRAMADDLQEVFAVHSLLQKAKLMLVENLDRNQLFDVYLGGEKVGQEGYVIHHDDMIAKLVNREVFSRANFMNNKKE